MKCFQIASPHSHEPGKCVCANGDNEERVFSLRRLSGPGVCLFYLPVSPSGMHRLVPAPCLPHPHLTTSCTTNSSPSRPAPPRPSRPTRCLDRSLLRRCTCGTVQSGALYTAANRDKVRLMCSVVSRSAQVGLGGRVTAINQFPVWQTRTRRSEVTDNPILLKYH